MNTKAFTIAKNAIAICKEAALAIKLTIGTPTTIPADTPIKTLETALGASSFRTEFAATEKANETINWMKKRWDDTGNQCNGKVRCK